jgi:hypothetical protein
MALTMKIDKAQGAAKLFFLLYKLKLLSEKRYHKLVNYLTVRSLKYQMKENPNGNPNESK